MNQQRCLLDSLIGVAIAGTLMATGNQSRGQAQASQPARMYTVTFADKRDLALPPQAVKSLPAPLTLRLELSETAQGETKQVRLFSRPFPVSDAAMEVVYTQTENQVSTCRAVLGLLPKKGDVAPPYQATIQAERSTIVNGFRLFLPAAQGQSVTAAPVFHPLAAQLFLGKMYDFVRGGNQTFALLQDWDGDALNPLTQLATLKLEAAGSTTLTLNDTPVQVRKLNYTVSGTGSTPQTGALYVASRGELLQAVPPVFGIPFDGGKAEAVATQTGNALVMKTDKGETIKARPVGAGYEVELYGKPAIPFAVATVDQNAKLVRVSERWNGRERLSRVGPGKVEFAFSSGDLENVSTPPEQAWFLTNWFATGTWEQNGNFAATGVGAKRRGTFIPMVLRGAYGQPFTLERLPYPSANTDKDKNTSSIRKYRMVVGDTAVYELYTDGAYLIHLTGSNGITATQTGYEAFAAQIKPPPPLAPTK